VLNNSDYNTVSCYYQEEILDISNGELEVISGEFNDQEQSAKMYCKYKTAMVEVTGWFEMKFENNEWIIKNDKLALNYLVLIAETMTTDYSVVLGTFEWEEGDMFGTTLSGGKLIVDYVVNDIVCYSIYFDDELSETWYNIEQGDNLLTAINPITGTFTVGKEYIYTGTKITKENRISIDATFTYDSINDKWCPSWTGEDAERR